MQLKSGAIADTASQEHSILHLIKGELEGVLTRQITVIFFLSKYYAYSLLPRSSRQINPPSKKTLLQSPI